jgi:hypothetical protein
MDIFYLIVSIIIGILLLIASVYILAIYCHPEDGGIGSSIWCKFLVVKKKKKKKNKIYF